jgi:hypothetical protein
VCGAIASTALFFLATIVFARFADRTDLTSLGLAPRTRLGWIAFVLSPASYVFHSHHTESLFLLLSLGAFYFATQRRWACASLLAGLCALTRVQGVFVAIVVALWDASFQPDARSKTRAFTRCGLVSGALYALFPLYQYVTVGDPFVSLHANATWDHATTSLPIVMRTFWLGNPWQSPTAGTLRQLAFFLVMVASIWTLRPARSIPWIALMVMNLLVFPLQSQFSDVFRFSTVLFPALFALADRIAHWPGWLVWPGIIALCILNHRMAYNFALEQWAY